MVEKQKTNFDFILILCEIYEQTNLKKIVVMPNTYKIA